MLLSHFSVSDSVWPYSHQPTRLPRPHDSPGKNTGVGCHFLLQCMTVKNESEVTQSCLTLSDPMDCSPPGSSVHGIFQARVLEWGAIGLWQYEERHKCWHLENLWKKYPFLKRWNKVQVSGSFSPFLNKFTLPMKRGRYARLH